MSIELTTMFLSELTSVMSCDPLLSLCSFINPVEEKLEQDFCNIRAAKRMLSVIVPTPPGPPFNKRETPEAVARLAIKQLVYEITSSLKTYVLEILERYPFGVYILSDQGQRDRFFQALLDLEGGTIIGDQSLITQAIGANPLDQRVSKGDTNRISMFTTRCNTLINAPNDHTVIIVPTTTRICLTFQPNELDDSCTPWLRTSDGFIQGGLTVHAKIR